MAAAYALQLLLLAVLQGHQFNWAAGADRLHVVSVGTGSWEEVVPMGRLAKIRNGIVRRIPAANGVTSLQAMMADASALNQLLLQWLGTGPNHRHIDAEVGSLVGDEVPGGPLLSYSRLDVQLEAEWLRDELGLPGSGRQVKQLRKMDRTASLTALSEIGGAYAKGLRREDFLLA